MPTKTCSAFSPVSHVKALACAGLLLGTCSRISAADAPPAPPLQISTAELETLMLPPRGWKLDKEVLDHYFWLMPDYVPGRAPYVVIYPFWPAFINLNITRDEGRISERTPGYEGAVGELLTDGLNSPDPKVKRKAALWLRHSLLLYFSGIRLSTANGGKDYAPWIKKEDARRLDQQTDHFMAGLNPMLSRGPRPEAISHLKLEEWLSDPGGKTFAAVSSYFDVIGATHYSLSADFVYPICWSWGRERGNKTLYYLPCYGDEIHATDDVRHLLGNEPPPEKGPLSLWMREVFLSYIAGKELLEGKALQLEDKESEPLLKEALQQWWAGIEKSQ